MLYDLLCQVRKNLFGHSEAVYSGYTCYTGIADFIPADIETVGYDYWTFYCNTCKQTFRYSI